jgi:hypothetical protein
MNSEQSAVILKRFEAPDEIRVLEKGRFGASASRRLFDRLWYGGPNAISNAVGYAHFYSRSHHAVIRVFDESGNVIETREHKGEFKDCG